VLRVNWKRYLIQFVHWKWEIDATEIRIKLLFQIFVSISIKYNYKYNYFLIRQCCINIKMKLPTFYNFSFFKKNVNQCRDHLSTNVPLEIDSHSRNRLILSYIWRIHVTYYLLLLMYDWQFNLLVQVFFVLV